MIVKQFKTEDYAMLQDWWTKHNHMSIPKESLSPIGITIFDEETPSCIGFIYVMPNCDMAQIAWTTTNPEISLRKRYKAMDTCINALLQYAYINGRKNIICFSKSSGLSKMLRKKGLAQMTPHSLLMGTFSQENS